MSPTNSPRSPAPAIRKSNPKMRSAPSRRSASSSPTCSLLDRPRVKALRQSQRRFSNGSSGTTNGQALAYVHFEEEPGRRSGGAPPHPVTAQRGVQQGCNGVHLQGVAASLLGRGSWERTDDFQAVRRVRNTPNRSPLWVGLILWPMPGLRRDRQKVMRLPQGAWM